MGNLILTYGKKVAVGFFGITHSLK